MTRIKLKLFIVDKTLTLFYQDLDDFFISVKSSGAKVGNIKTRNSMKFRMTIISICHIFLRLMLQKYTVVAKKLQYADFVNLVDSVKGLLTNLAKILGIWEPN